MTPNEGVEKPNSEPGAQDLESYFVAIICHIVAPVSFLIRFTTWGSLDFSAIHERWPPIF